MTAVQQYWIVENDVNLVSSLTPVPVADEDALKATAVSVFEFLTDSTPTDGYAGLVAVGEVTFVTIMPPEYSNPWDTADRWKGAASVATLTVATAQQSYSNPYDTADKWKGSPAAATLTVTTVVITYSNLYDTADKWKGAPSVGSVTIT